jgi:hypothetical protein
VKEFIVELPLEKIKNSASEVGGGKKMNEDLQALAENLHPTVSSTLFSIGY